MTLKETRALSNSVGKGIKNIKNVDVVICPPFPFILNLKSKILGAQPKAGRMRRVGCSLKLGAQDCFWEQKGAYTGEVSPKMLKDLGCQYVILGHSERRIYLGETDEMINKKLKAALKVGLSPILCVGDVSRESKEDIKRIDSQLEKGLQGLKKSILSNLIITYEPVWAISTTRGSIAASPRDAMEGAIYTRKVLMKLLGKASVRKIKILYGGSVDSKNVRDFIYEAKMDGVLVGGASLDHQEFIKLVKNVGKG